MKKLVLLGVSAVFLAGCSASSGSGVKQLETHDGYLVECVFAGSGNGLSCDWEHQVKK